LAVIVFKKGFGRFSLTYFEKFCDLETEFVKLVDTVILPV